MVDTRHVKAAVETDEELNAMVKTLGYAWPSKTEPHESRSGYGKLKVGSVVKGLWEDPTKAGYKAGKSKMSWFTGEVTVAAGCTVKVRFKDGTEEEYTYADWGKELRPSLDSVSDSDELKESSETSSPDSLDKAIHKVQSIPTCARTHTHTRARTHARTHTNIHTHGRRR